MSKLGFLLSGVFIAITILLISTQGVFGESFIVLILGLPWVLLPSYFEFGNVSGVFLYAFVFTPILINALILYYIGWLIGSYYERKISA
jgi:hypothetical protein